MIQRKQSIWLLLAALLSAGVFFFDLYRTDGNSSLRVADNFPLLLVALVTTALPLITIFMFRNRKRQVRMAAMCLVAESSFISLMLASISRPAENTTPAAGGSYWIGAVLPVVAMVFIVMAIVGIRKDEKLVRSTDRLR